MFAHGRLPYFRRRASHSKHALSPCSSHSASRSKPSSRVSPHPAPGRLTPPSRAPPSCARPPHSAIPARLPHPAPRSAALPHYASPSRPSTVVPQSVLAHRGHGVHRAITTPGPPVEGHRRAKHRLLRSAKDTTTGGPACCKNMFQVFQMFHRYVASVLYGRCKSRSRCCTY